jgi:hypothetical protein
MTVESPSPFAQAIQEHLELKRRNAGLDERMPIQRYATADPFENHPLFKSEEQARLEETMDGEPAVQLTSSALPWPGEETAEVTAHALRTAEDSGDALWDSGPREFNWGD